MIAAEARVMSVRERLELRAIESLIADPRARVEMDDLRVMGGIVFRLKRGQPIQPHEVSLLSRVRAEIARVHRAQRRPVANWDGAA